MAKAGFYPIESHRIVFGRDGEWYSDGERIPNRRIARLFSRSIRRRAEGGGYELRVGDERATIEVEDTPYVVRQIEGEPESGLTVLLNDGTREPLDPATLEVGPDNAIYCRVKQGEHEARLLRPAYYTLAQWIGPDADGSFVFDGGGRKHPIRPRGAR